MRTPLTILVLDRIDGRREAIHDVVVRCRIEEAPPILHLHKAGDGDWEPSVSNEVSADLALVHWNDEPKLSDQKVNGPVEKAAVRLAYSGGGIARDLKLPEGWLRIPRPVDSASDLSIHEWQELLLWISNPKRSMEYLPRALQPDFARVATALLILCQGFRAMTSGHIASAAEEQERVWKRKWWSKPFGPIPDIEERLKKEFGNPKLPENVSVLIK